jgi:hypothetical protein
MDLDQERRAFAGELQRPPPLVDMNGRVLKLLARIVQWRCHVAGAY